jgi:phosphoserine aminotransferase
MQPVGYPSSPKVASSSRQHNFSPGPGTLPLEVIEEVRAELPVYDGVGASIMEISHRSPAYDEVHDSARQLMRDLLGLGGDWHVLFLQGGASMQFHQVALNFLPEGGSADYLVTGEWAGKALKEAGIVAKARNARARAAASSEDDNFCYIPESASWDLDSGAAYLHYTSNNTIFGTQFADEPEAPEGVPLVCDASSDFLSRYITPGRYGLIYAGAQKNIGPAGVTAVLVHDEFLQRRVSGLPTILDYGTHVKKLFNTPPVFAVYVVEKVLRWLKGQGGLDGIAQRNDRKARILYDAMDGTDFYRGTARPPSRSNMNVTFRIAEESLEADFLAQAKKEGLLGLKGHRSVGGLRASIYNACPVESVEALVGFMRQFERQRG